MLNGKEVLLGVTGGIAAYKSVLLLRELTKEGANVHVIMTKSAQEFVGQLTFQTLSGNPVTTEIFTLFAASEIGHVSLAERADLLVIAPATANIIGKIATGIADDFLSTMVMATRVPVLFAPAMNTNMWASPVVQANIDRLKSMGYFFMDPAEGELACGTTGRGKLADVDEIMEEIRTLLYPDDLAGEKILITAGPTEEAIDPARCLTNRSSGKMGYNLATVARRRGAEVILISGPSRLPVPCRLPTIHCTTAREMEQRINEHLDGVTTIIMAAAVADFRPAEEQTQKIKRAGPHCLELEANPDILAGLGRNKGNRFLVGFAAETDDLVDNAKEKIRRKNLDMIVANDITAPGAGFCYDTNIVKIIDREGTISSFPLMSKEKVAEIILDHVLALKKDGMAS
ncbi:MAG: bifunctional phosphopantothenoylcysteine decarboxylase/phosphopantothenate--cysteine ligase CoaBC [Deltaproteobacteria bacterium]|nr:bifunctional phosphopantothenoylcysteine decarboxylase/phosphopantothenate--cysteine ligase CoaBC [Candidatus Anaeroferrophillus wilburensis]MBN2889708.1 bifunctional phosphopantothenoylcysteine decarboxylase/phosphopantothenate--cysteine ligase CoaBC [Deltaproteobacteria bacterium]